jgi:hypothetical protein
VHKQKKLDGWPDGCAYNPVEKHPFLEKAAVSFC